MNKDYATIAASTIAALLLAVSPAATGDAGKKASGRSGGVSTGGSVSGTTGGTLSTDSPSASPKMGDDKDKLDAEKKTGLDRADEAAGQHGQQGRDTAREKQERRGLPRRQ